MSDVMSTVPARRPPRSAPRFAAVSAQHLRATHRGRLVGADLLRGQIHTAARTTAELLADRAAIIAAAGSTDTGRSAASPSSHRSPRRAGSSRR